jgi:putative endonuclease
LLERNFRCRSGEIDLIMRDGTTLVFIEVRMRRQSRFGSAAESINASKLRRIRSAAALWLRITHCCDPVRLDVITLDGEDCDTARIAWIRGVDT